MFSFLVLYRRLILCILLVVYRYVAESFPEFMEKLKTQGGKCYGIEKSLYSK